MAERRSFYIQNLKTKLEFITSQKEELHGVLDEIIQKVTAEAKKYTETKSPNQALQPLLDMNLELDSVLGFLTRLSGQLEDVKSGSTTLSKLQQKMSSSSSSSSSVLEALSGLEEETASGSHKHEDIVSRLVHRMDVLELAMSTCRGEISQASEQHTELKQEMEAQQKKVEEKFKSLGNKRIKEKKKLTFRCDQLEEGIERLEALNNQQYEDLTKLEEKHEGKLEDMEKQVKDMELKHLQDDYETRQRGQQVELRIQKLELGERHMPRLDGIEKKMTEVENKLQIIEKEPRQREDDVTMGLQNLEDGGEHKARFDSIEDKLSHIESKQQTAAQEYKHREADVTMRLKNLEDEVKSSKKFDDIQKKLTEFESKHQHAEKANLKEINDVKQRLKNLEDDDKHTKRCDDIEKRLKDSEMKHQQAEKANITEINDVKKRLQSLEDGDKHTKRCDDIEKRLQHTETKHQQAEKSNVKEINDVKKRLQSLEDDNKHTKRCDDTEKRLKETEDKLQQAEMRNTPENKDVQKQVQTVEDKEKHMTGSDRIETQLETFLQGKNIHPFTVDRVRREVKDLLNKMNTLYKLQDQTPAPAFTAELDRTRPVTVDTCHINYLTRVFSNTGNCYNPKTCLFTAPRDGVCVAIFATLQVGEGGVGVCVRHDRSGSGVTRVFCRTWPTADNPSRCDVGVVEVKAGDTLGVLVWNVVGKPQLSCPGTSFSCFFIG